MNIPSLICRSSWPPLFWLYARYLCSRDALGLKAEQPAGQARRATIGYIVYNYFGRHGVVRSQIQGDVFLLLLAVKLGMQFPIPVNPDLSVKKRGPVCI